MVTGPRMIDGKTYLFNSSGAMKKKGWRKDADKNWYYVKKDGSCTTGWKKIGKKWYWFYRDGIMACNTKIKIKGKWYKFNKSGVCTNP